ncbi:Hypothetical predicted protein, partial [Paramuricea clavata]
LEPQWTTSSPCTACSLLLDHSYFNRWFGDSMKSSRYPSDLNHNGINRESLADFEWNNGLNLLKPVNLNLVMSQSHEKRCCFSRPSTRRFISSVEHVISRSYLIEVKDPFVVYFDHWQASFSGLPEKINLLCEFIGGCGFDFLPSDALMKFLAQFLCGGGGFDDIICENVIFLLCGYDYAQLNKTRLPVYVSHTPAGTSAKNIIHYGQMVESGKCQRFNYYDEKENLVHYNKTEPPTFNMSNVRVPTVLYYGSNDWLADPHDVTLLAKALPNVVHIEEIPKWEHLDFIWGLDAARLVYKPLIKYLNQFSGMEKKS